MNERSSSIFKGETVFSEVSGRITNLPRGYGDTKIVIIPRDPLWFYAYWEVSHSAVNQLKNKIGENNLNCSRWILRVYDITDIDFNGTNSHKYFDITINTYADNWYVNACEYNRVWVVDIGIVTPDGEFIAVARSNVLGLPKHGVSSITDEQWAILQKEFEKLLQLSGVDKIGKSSFDVTKLMRERWEEIVSLSLPTSHFGASSFRAPISEDVKPKGFWLKADTELIVYGATEPTAKLTVQGQNVSLKPDGSFSLRFYLPDGQQEYIIEAVSQDGSMKKEITFVVTRETR